MTKQKNLTIRLHRYSSLEESGETILWGLMQSKDLLWILAFPIAIPGAQG